MAADATPAGGKVLQTVSGHSNTFMQVTDTHIWKVSPCRTRSPVVLVTVLHTRRSVCLAQLTDAPERDMLVTLMDCPELKDIVPTFTREVPLEQFIGKEPGKDAVVVELQDVTSGFGKDPCIMDVKLGTAPGGKSLAPPRPSCAKPTARYRGRLARSCRAERAAVRRCWRGAVSSALFPLHRSGTRTFLEDEVDNPKVRDELLKTATPTLPEPGTRTPNPALP